MSNKTLINPNLNTTVINSEIDTSTVVNPDAVVHTEKLEAGTILADKYTIVNPLNVLTGEADLYICTYNDNEYVAKVYRRQRAVKESVVSGLKSISSEYVAPLFETGSYNNLPFEILPYYKNGSLQGKKYTLSELKETIIPCINEALKVLHDNNIIHKDLKPSNIMLSDDKKHVALIDFGISSVVEEGNTVLVTQTGMTPEYSAPETFRNLFLDESDYYSFGITLYELFCGHTPYKNMNADDIAKVTAVQRIPFPKYMPQELKELISAITYFDITNRHDKDNPNRRWTYNEVLNWCKGEKQVLPGEGIGASSYINIPTYTFLKQDYNDVPSLVTALAKEWEEGKKQLYNGLLSSFFKQVNIDITGYCMSAQIEARNNAGKDDIIFWGLLYKINPDLSGFYWKGQTYESLAALGRNMLELLWKNDNSNTPYWDSILKNKLLSQYIQIMNLTDDNLTTAVSALETAHNLVEKTVRDAQMNYYIMAYLLSGQKLFRIGSNELKDVSELVEYMKKLLKKSYESFEDFCHNMVDYNDTLDVQLEAWLISLGKRAELTEWKNRMLNQ